METVAEERSEELLEEVCGRGVGRVRGGEAIGLEYDHLSAASLPRAILIRAVIVIFNYTMTRT